LKRARVTLAPDGRRAQPLSVMTGADGKFRITDLAPGRYRLTVSRNGFVRQEYGQRRPGQPGLALTLAPGQKMNDLLFRLLPGAIVTGRIFDEEGEPAAGVMVMLLRQRYIRGSRQWAPSESTQTNDLGEYRIAGLTPGRVYVSATYPSGIAMIAAAGGSLSAATIPSISTEVEEETYAPTFYPGTSDISQARAIDLGAGEEVRSIDMTMMPVRSVRVRGRVVNPYGSEVRLAAHVQLVQRGFAVRGLGMRSAMATESSQGTFELRGVTPGSYIISAMWSDSGRMFAARENLDVGSVDVDGVVLSLAPSTEITGRVRMEGDPEFRFLGFNVSLAPHENSESGGGGSGVNQNGAFSIRNVFPESYRVAVTSSQGSYYVKSLKFGSQEVPDFIIHLARASSTTLEILLSPNAATVSGTVRDADQLPVAAATVVLVPETSKRGNIALYKTATSDQLGQFLIRGVPPGSYKLFAWDDVENGAWLDPEFLSVFEQKGESILVDEGSRRAVELKALKNNSQ
jgi:hypothetical protein